MDLFYREGFVLSDSLEWEVTPGFITLVGEIGCLGNIVVRVHKILRLVDARSTVDDADCEVQTMRYAYNAFVRGHGNILRHDNIHPHPGHPDSHHRHECEWRRGEEDEGRVVYCGFEGWPTLGEFIQKIADWYWEHREELPEPDGNPSLDLRRPGGAATD